MVGLLASRPASCLHRQLARARRGLRPRSVEPAHGQVRLALSNSFGFGGNNCALCVRPRPRRPLTTVLRVFVDGIAFWSPTLPGWPIARAAFAAKAVPSIRRRSGLRRELRLPPSAGAPDSVALALEVAGAAVREAGCAAGELPSIFTSAHGDLAVNDYMCSTLATQPTAISPTRFHNAVHNAASGYWTIGTACMASSAVSAFEQSFAAGLLEAATNCVADKRPVLLVAFDVQANGALASVTRSEGLLAAAFVLAPLPGPRTQAAFEITLSSGPSTIAPLRSLAAQGLRGNGMADVLPFVEALALDSSAVLELPLSRRLALRLAPQRHG